MRTRLVRRPSNEDGPVSNLLAGKGASANASVEKLMFINLVLVSLGALFVAAVC